MSNYYTNWQEHPSDTCHECGVPQEYCAKCGAEFCPNCIKWGYGDHVHFTWGDWADGYVTASGESLE